MGTREVSGEAVAFFLARSTQLTFSTTSAAASSQTVFDAFRHAADHHGPRPFLQTLPETAAIYGIDAGTITYAQAHAEVTLLSRHYRQAGYGHGHRVGLLLENRPAFFMHWLALNALGVSVVPISSEMRAAELHYLFEHSELCLVICLPQRLEDLRRSATQAGHAIGVITPAAAADGALPAAPTAAPLAGSPSSDTECALLYTSGTTGRPKGCVLTNFYFLRAGGSYVDMGGICVLQPGQERLLTPLPLVHMNAMACSTMAMILIGGCIIALDRFHPKTWWDSVRQSQATIFHYLGVMPAMLMGLPPDELDARHQVRFGFGAGVDKLRQADFEARFKLPLVEAWAMTETGGGAMLAANHEPRRIGQSCIGKPDGTLVLRIVDDQGQEASVGTPGELQVRATGPDPRRGFFREYLKDEQATAEAWKDGWFHTGDIVRQDADGYLYFMDRKKNVIRRSGENISAVEVESVLLQHPAVQAVAVAAVPDPIRGDEVLALVVPRSAQQAEHTARSITEFCLTQLAYYKAPGYIAFIEQLPLTSSQKVQRGKVKELAHSLFGSGATVDLRALKRRQD